MDWSAITVATIGAIAVVASPVAAALVVKRSERRTVAHLDKVHYQVANEHTTNLRDDIDEIAALVRSSHQELTARVDRVSRAIGTVKRSQDALTRRLTQHIDGD